MYKVTIFNQFFEYFSALVKVGRNKVEDNREVV